MMVLGSAIPFFLAIRFASRANSLILATSASYNGVYHKWVPTATAVEAPPFI